MATPSNPHASVNREADYLDVPVPYWLRPSGSQFEAAWATDRRDELQDILADAFRNGYRRGVEAARDD